MYRACTKDREAARRGLGEAAVQHGMDQLSAIIAAFPGQYFWHHRRFKHPVDGLVPRPREPWRTRGLRLLVDPLPSPS